jgi:hypothetical protein
MKKLSALISALLLVATLQIPAQSAGVDYSVYQKTLSTFSPTAASLTSQQKAQIKAAVDANPSAEKFICTGIRYYSQPMSVNILVRKRAKAACEYAKELNPDLSTWYQNKPTQARSYAGKVLLTIKSPIRIVDEVGSGTEEEVSPPESPAPPTQQYGDLGSITIDLESCKLRENPSPVPGFKGFPANGMLPHSGVVKVAIIPVDFSNAPGDPGIGARLRDYADFMTQWANFWSRGNMVYEVQIHEDWIRAPLGADWYQFPEGHGQGVRKQSDEESLNQILQAADPYFDFSGVDFVLGFVPSKAEFDYFFGLYGNKSAQTQEGNQSFFVYGGLGFYDGAREPGSLLVHQILHAQGFLGHGPANGAGYGIMQNQWGESKAISSWEAFVAGWWADSEYLCVDATKVEGIYKTSLSSLDSTQSTPKSLIIRLDHEQAIVVENRQDKGGVLTAYKLNVNKPWYRDDSAGVPADEKNWWQYLREADGDIPIQQSVEYQNIKISNLGGGSFTIENALAKPLKNLVAARSSKVINRDNYAGDLPQLDAIQVTNGRRELINQHCSCCGCKPID